MWFDSVSSLRAEGFSGFVSVRTLKTDGYNDVPQEPGVYIVVRDKETTPVFLSESGAGHLNGDNPTLPVSDLEENWVKNAKVLYIGRAGGGKRKATLANRIRKLINFGSGKLEAHWGGRPLWQLADADDLLIAWKATTDGDTYKSDLLTDFTDHYGVLPFANLKKGS